MRYHHHANDTVSKIENDTIEKKRPEETEKEFIPSSLPVQQERKKPEEFNQRRIEKSHLRNSQDESKKK
jgi:hypothetical protein